MAGSGRRGRRPFRSPKRASPAPSRTGPPSSPGTASGALKRCPASWSAPCGPMNRPSCPRRPFPQILRPPSSPGWPRRSPPLPPLPPLPCGARNPARAGNRRAVTHSLTPDDYAEALTWQRDQPAARRRTRRHYMLFWVLAASCCRSSSCCWSSPIPGPWSGRGSRSWPSGWCRTCSATPWCWGHDLRLLPLPPPHGRPRRTQDGHTQRRAV